MAQTPTRKLTAAVRAAGVACFIQMAGCGGADSVLPSLVIPEPKPVVAILAAPEAPAVPPPAAIEPEPAAVVAAPPAPSADEKAPAKAPEPPAKTPAKTAATATPATSAIAIAPARKAEEPAAAAKAAEPPLDVTSLKARLRETAAIGVLAKLSLRSQVDELIESFRLHYEGGQKTSLAALRKPYDALVMKVLDLLQEGDPPLARSISGSREAIWGILADREKFNLAR